MALKSEIAGNNIVFTAGNLVSVIIAFITSILLARLLGPDGFGLYSLALIVTGMFTVFTEFITGSSITRFTAFFLSRNEWGKIKSLIVFLLKYRFAVSLPIAAILLLFPHDIGLLVFHKPDISPVIVFSGLLIFVNSFIEFFIGFFNGLGNFRYIVLIRFVERLSKLAFPAIFIFLGLGYIGALYGLTAASIATMAIISLLLLTYRQLFASRRRGLNTKAIYQFGLWSFLSSVTITIFALVDSFMVSILRTIPEIGFYKIAVTWTFAMVNFVPVSSLVMYAYFSRHQPVNEASQLLSHTIRYSSLIIFPLAFLLSAFAEPIVLLFYGPDYLISAQVLSVLGLAAIPVVLASIFNAYFAGINRPGITTKILSVSIVANVLLNYFFIAAFGLMGAAAATIIALVMEVVMMLIVVSAEKRAAITPSSITKPFIASLIVYGIAGFFVINDFIGLFAYGLASLAAYLFIMLAIQGVRHRDIADIYNLLRKKRL